MVKTTLARRRVVQLLVVAVIAFATTVVVAQAASLHFFTGGLGGNTGYAHPDAHSISYIEGNADHNNFCVAGDTGYTGYVYAPKITAKPQACSSSGGHAAISYSPSCCQHGYIGNSNGFGITVYSSTHYDY